METSQGKEQFDATMPSEPSNSDEADLSSKTFPFETELSTVDSINKKNVQFFRHLREMICNLKTLQVPSPSPNEFEQIAGYYKKQEHVMNNELGQIHLKQTDSNKEQQDLVKNIKRKEAELETLTRQLNSFTCGTYTDGPIFNRKYVLIEKPHKQSEMKALKKQYQCVAFSKEFYMKKFGFRVVTGPQDHFSVWCNVYFDERDEFGIKFLFSKPLYKILKVDATSILTSTQQTYLEKKFGPTFDNVPALMCTLRYLVLNKK